jgi:hypothetical protein
MRSFLIACLVILVCAAESQAGCRLRTRLQQRPAVSQKVLNVTRSVTVGGCANGSCVRPATPALLPPAIPKK